MSMPILNPDNYRERTLCRNTRGFLFYIPAQQSPESSLRSFGIDSAKCLHRLAPRCHQALSKVKPTSADGTWSKARESMSMPILKRTLTIYLVGVFCFVIF